MRDVTHIFYVRASVYSWQGGCGRGTNVRRQPHTLKAKLGHSITQVFRELNAFSFHNNAYLCLHVARGIAYIYYNLASIVKFETRLARSLAMLSGHVTIDRCVARELKTTQKIKKKKIHRQKVESASS